MADPQAPLGVLAHYTLLERLDPAGPGELYRARDTRLGRTVAVRRLPAGYGDPAALVTQARSLAVLSHPNVIAVFDVGEADGRVHLVFEYLAGQSLRAEMAGRQVNVRRALEIATQIADAIADAHAAGFLHGGLSPDSVVITTRGRVKVPAFELAARAGFEEDGAGVRLRDYESPEEARGGAPDERSDIYSVGAMLYEMLTTRRPSHRGASAPSASNAHVPRELDAVVLKAVDPNPHARWQSSATFAAELRSVAALLDVRGTGEDAERAGRPAPDPRRPLLALTLAAVVLLLLWWVTRG